MHSEKVLEIAIAAALEAAIPLTQATGGYRDVEAEEAHDVKLKADRESEIRIRKFLTDAAPYPIIGEEQGGDASLWHSDERYWVVDPLDGTYNYLRSMPQCCVSIALMRGPKAEAGAVLDFNSDTLFTGGMGLPFCINRKAHAPKWESDRAKACLSTGFPHEMKRDPESMNRFINRLLEFKKVRMIGTAALAVSYVAAGYCDVYYETGIKLWDIAAGLAFANSVGAAVRLREWDDKPLHFDICMAARESFLF
jgi:myo-inositol-1(or 4)-monophosphatase